MCSKYILQTAIIVSVFSVFQTEEFDKWKRYPKLIGGSEVPPHKYDYFARLNYKGKFMCGGTLIKNNVVVTAGHCVQGLELKYMRVHTGTYNLRLYGNENSVTQAYIPKDFRKETFHLDVAVLIITPAWQNDDVTTISMNMKPLLEGNECQVAGHGRIKENGAFSEVLQEANVSVTNHAECQISYYGQYVIDKFMICAANPGVDACNGDSGGPLICNGMLAGIVSFGIGCARPEFPGVYTDISKVQEFISRAMARARILTSIYHDRYLLPSMYI